MTKDENKHEEALKSRVEFIESVDYKNSNFLVLVLVMSTGFLGIMGYLKVIANLLYEMNERQKAKVEEETVNQGRFI